MHAIEAIASRRSVRAFKPDPVPLDIVRQILEVSARAPSGTNMQPWKARVVTGAARERLTRAALAAGMNGAELKAEYKYYPDRFPEPYLTRRRKVGWDLYGLLGIQRGETDKMRAQHARNQMFFDAPVGIVFSVDRVLEIGSWLDYGMFLENVMVAARAFGLHSCPQVAWTPYHETVREVLGMPEEEVVVCGMALGYEDESAVENSLRTERAPLSDWVSFHDE